MRASRRAWIVGMLATVSLGVSLGLPEGAGAITGLTLHKCYGSGAGCINVAGTPLQGANAVAVSPNGSVYVTSSTATDMGSGSGFVAHFFAGKGGALSYDGCISDDGDGGACGDIPGPNATLGATDGVAVSPNGRSVYVSNYYGALTHFFANATQGQLTYDGCVTAGGSGGYCLQAIKQGDADPFEGMGGVAVSPNASAPNSSVFTTSDDGVVAHLFAAPAQGQLSYDGCVSDDGTGGICGDLPGTASPMYLASGIAVNPRGTGVYVASQTGDVSQLAASPPDGGGITGFVGCRNVDGSNGCTTTAPIGPALNGAYDVVVSPNGASVYVAAAGNNAVSHFFADPAGKTLLRFDGCVSDDGSAGACKHVPGHGTPLQGVDALGVSPDGQTLFATSADASSLSWFSLGPQGQLTFQGCLADDATPGCTNPPGEPLGNADGVAVSPDGGTVYVTGRNGTVGSFVVKTAPKPKPPLTLTYSPRPLHAGKRTTVTFRVMSKGKPVRSAQVKFAGRTGFTGVRGYVSFTLVLESRTYTVSASATGKKPTSITLHPR
jgi:sugar lactone lactonase YvrE